MGTKNKQVELNDERRALVDRMYRKNRRLFKFLASKYAHNNEDSEDIEMYALQILMVWIAGTEKSDDEIMKYAGYYINRAYASAYKDVNVNDKELEILYGDIVDGFDIEEDGFEVNKDKYLVESEDNDAYDNMRSSELQCIIDSIENDDDRMILHMIADEGMNITEVASELGRSKQAIQYRLRNVVSKNGKLKKFLYLS